MNVLMTSIGRRGYLADYFRTTDPPCSSIIGTTDRHSSDFEFTVGLSACDSSYVVPSVEDDAYIDVILDICEQEDISFVFSLLDTDNYILSKNTTRFEAIGVVPFVSGFEVNQICLDKYRTYEFLSENGFDTPRTCTSINNFEAGGSYLPAVIKPRTGCASVGIAKVENSRQLRAYFEPETHVIQEWVSGEEYGLDIFNDLDGQMLSCVVKKKIKMRAGETDQAVTVRDSRLTNLAERVASLLGHVGPLDVDVLVSGDRVAIIDFNPRFGGGYPLAHAAGANFPQLMVDIALGRNTKVTANDYKEDLVMLKDASPLIFALDKLAGLPKQI